VIRLSTAALAAALSAPLPLAAQGWTVDAAAGRAVHDPVSARIGSTVASLGLSWEGGQGVRWLYLSAGGPLGGPGPAWGAGGAGSWLGVERGALALGASVGAHVFGYGSSQGTPEGGGATVELLPTVALTLGSVRAELSSGFVGTADVAGDSTESRGVHESGARLSWMGTEGVELAAQARYLRTQEGDFPYAGVSGAYERGRLGAWGYVGSWLDGDLPDPAEAFGAGVAYEVIPRTRLQLSWRQEPVDPVYFGTPRRTWTVQVSRSIGRAGDRSPPSAPSAAPVVRDGWAVFRLPAAAHPAAPSLVGSFTAWKPVAMSMEGGFWTARVQVQPGAHHYGYRADDGAFFVPAGVPTVDDGMGGTSAVLVVP
jgi:hypothetical protein